MSFYNHLGLSYFLSVFDDFHLTVEKSFTLDLLYIQSEHYVTKTTFFKGWLLGRRQFLTVRRPSKMMKSAFYFMLKALFVLEILTFLLWYFGYLEKWEAKINFKSVWLPLLLEILDNICTVIICCPVCEVINFETNFSFLVKLFFYVTKKSGQNCKYLKNEKSF